MVLLRVRRSDRLIPVLAVVATALAILSIIYTTSFLLRSPASPEGSSCRVRKSTNEIRTFLLNDNVGVFYRSWIDSAFIEIVSKYALHLISDMCFFSLKLKCSKA